MAIVKRGNCEFTVADHQVEEYLEKGYSLLGEGGKVIREKHPKTVEDFKKQFEAAAKKNEELQEALDQREAENEALKEELAALKAQQGGKPEKPSKPESGK